MADKEYNRAKRIVRKLTDRKLKEEFRKNNKLLGILTPYGQFYMGLIIEEMDKRKLI